MVSEVGDDRQTLTSQLTPAFRHSQPVELLSLLKALMAAVVELRMYGLAGGRNHPESVGQYMAWWTVIHTIIWADHTPPISWAATSAWTILHMIIICLIR